MYNPPPTFDVLFSLRSTRYICSPPTSLLVPSPLFRLLLLFLGPSIRCSVPLDRERHEGLAAKPDYIHLVQGPDSAPLHSAQQLFPVVSFPVRPIHRRRFQAEKAGGHPTGKPATRVLPGNHQTFVFHSMIQVAHCCNQLAMFAIPLGNDAKRERRRKKKKGKKNIRCKKGIQSQMRLTISEPRPMATCHDTYSLVASV